MFEQLELLLKTIDEHAVESDAGANPTSEGIKLKPVLSPQPVWELRVGSNREVLKELEVAYGKDDDKGGKAAKRTYKPVSPDQANLPGSLAAVSVGQGHYEFRPERDLAPPTECRAILVGAKDATPRTVRLAFPKSDRCFVIRIAEFDGDREKLFQKVKSMEVTNRFTDISARENFTVVFGNINAQGATTGEGIIGLNLSVSVGGVRDQKVSRVWMLFPLSKEQCDNQVKQFKDLSRPIATVPQKIREKAVRPEEKGTAVALFTEPRWFELSPTGAGFEGQIRLVDKSSDYKKLREQFPQVWRILVWEGGDEGAPRAVVLEENQLLKAEEIEGWGDKVKAAEGRAAKESAPRDKPDAKPAAKD